MLQEHNQLKEKKKHIFSTQRKSIIYTQIYFKNIFIHFEKFEFYKN